jgi:hypothetical protein
LICIVIGFYTIFGSYCHVTTRVTVGVVVGWQGRLWKTLEGPGMIVCHWAYRGLRPINTAYLPTVDPVL